MTLGDVAVEMEQLTLVDVDDFLESNPTPEQKIDYMTQLTDIWMRAESAYEQIRMTF